MREARRRVVHVFERLAQQCVLQVDHRCGHDPSVVAEEEPEVRGHLVVTRATRAQLAPENTETFGQPALESGVDVLVGRNGHEDAGLDVDSE